MTDSNAPVGTPGVRRTSRRVVLILIAVILLGTVYLVIKVITWNPNYVIEVYEANQLCLRSGEGVVLIGVESPPSVEKQVGRPARDLAKQYVLNRKVRLELDKQPRDQANWILAYVFVEKDGKEVFLNEELLRRGYGTLNLVFPNLKYRGRLEAAEAEGKAGKLGVWDPNYKPERE